jgi:hypothetical protein
VSVANLARYAALLAAMGAVRSSRDVPLAVFLAVVANVAGVLSADRLANAPDRASR